MKRFCAVLLLVMVTMLGQAASAVHPKIVMKSIEMLKSTESYGDELYLVVTEFNSRNDHKQYTIPRYPITWPSRALNQVNNLNVWSGDLKDGEEVHLSIELVEHDAPPFNIDDSIGSADLILKNQDGKLKIQWDTRHGMTDHEEKHEGKQTLHYYTFKGDYGKYLAKFVTEG